MITLDWKPALDAAHRAALRWLESVAERPVGVVGEHLMKHPLAGTFDREQLCLSVSVHAE